ncbi:hypothetical protein [Leptospira barantonii]|uniref:hypothetical protein n=1 Tax=Leptospira barantonii TaxID=2023184 RepID=UPI001438416B|nr:hypothetical protein [Leptospira barantonii]
MKIETTKQKAQYSERDSLWSINENGFLTLIDRRSAINFMDRIRDARLKQKELAQSSAA